MSCGINSSGRIATLHNGSMQATLKCGANSLTKQLLAFSRQQVLEAKVLNINESLDPNGFNEERRPP